MLFMTVSWVPLRAIKAKHEIHQGGNTYFFLFLRTDLIQSQLSALKPCIKFNGNCTHWQADESRASKMQANIHCKGEQGGSKENQRFRSDRCKRTYVKVLYSCFGICLTTNMDWIFLGEKEMSLARPEHKACTACRWWQNTSSLSCCVAEFLSRKRNGFVCHFTRQTMWRFLKRPIRMVPSPFLLCIFSV